MSQKFRYVLTLMYKNVFAFQKITKLHIRIRNQYNNNSSKDFSICSTENTAHTVENDLENILKLIFSTLKHV